MDTYTDFVQNQTKRDDLPKKKARPKKNKIEIEVVTEIKCQSETELEFELEIETGTETVECYIGLGSNIGKTKENIEAAIRDISNCEGIKLDGVASLYLTKAWGKTDQQNFVNTVIKIVTRHQPTKLLDIFQKIETQLGRVKIEKWGPRMIDIDILLYADVMVNGPRLTIPHPYLTQRSFVLAPLYELNKDISIPKLGKLEKFMDEEQINEDILEIF